MITADKANAIKKAVDEGFRLWWKWSRKPPEAENEWDAMAAEFQTVCERNAPKRGEYDLLTVDVMASLMKDVERNIK